MKKSNKYHLMFTVVCNNCQSTDAGYVYVYAGPDGLILKCEWCQEQEQLVMYDEEDRVRVVPIVLMTESVHE